MDIVHRFRFYSNREGFLKNRKPPEVQKDMVAVTVRDHCPAFFALDLYFFGNELARAPVRPLKHHPAVFCQEQNCDDALSQGFVREKAQPESPSIVARGSHSVS